MQKDKTPKGQKSTYTVKGGDVVDNTENDPRINLIDEIVDEISKLITNWLLANQRPSKISRVLAPLKDAILLLTELEIYILYDKLKLNKKTSSLYINIQSYIGWVRSEKKQFKGAVSIKKRSFKKPGIASIYKFGASKKPPHFPKKPNKSPGRDDGPGTK